MVQAILEGRKTMTRRIVKDQPGASVQDCYARPDGAFIWLHLPKGLGCGVGLPFLCPYGQVGDVLWVREEHYRYGKWVRNGFTKAGREKWKFVPIKNTSLERVGYSPDTVYYNDDPPQAYRKSRDNGDPSKPQWYKRLARFMPKAACRILLEITHIRVERLRDISEVEAIAEGVEKILTTGDMAYRSYAVKDGGGGVFPYVSFKTLWQKINGEESWEANPWVWVVSFKRVERPVNFHIPNK